MKIGDLAKQTGCKVVTIRYYEKEGLLPEPERTEGNYRSYTQNDLDRLRLIRHCRQHGMNLEEIRKLLAWSDDPACSCEWIGALIGEHIASVDKQIEDLKHLRSHLVELASRCSGDAGPNCGILKSLKKGDTCPVCKGGCAFAKD